MGNEHQHAPSQQLETPATGTSGPVSNFGLDGLSPDTAMDGQGAVGNAAIAAMIGGGGGDEHGHDHGGHMHRRPRDGRGGHGGVARANNTRFDEDQGLRDAEAATNYLQAGDTGMSVRILQQALIDAGYDVPVTGIFDPATTAKVREFQTAQGIGVDGIVGPDTMGRLDNVHQSHTTVVDIAQAHTAADPLAGTRAINADETAAFNAAITTAPQLAGGAAPVFEADNAHGNYEARLQAQMTATFTRWHADYVAIDTRRGEAGGIHDWSELENVAGASKRETDRVFGTYKVGAVFTEASGRLRDAFEDEGDKITNQAGYADYIVRDLTSYALNTEMDDINTQHGADPSRGPEAAINARVRSAYAAANRQQVLESHIAWPGLADGGQVSLQRHTAPDNAGNRTFLWQQFGTVIHEYIHTLEHADHIAYRGGLDEQSGGLTLREGMCDYFTKMVWETVDFNPVLRGEVEGPYHEVGTVHPVPADPGYYDSVAEAERGVGVVGFRNAAAAFFLGETSLIGGP